MHIKYGHTNRWFGKSLTKSAVAVAIKKRQPLHRIADSEDVFINLSTPTETDWSQEGLTLIPAVVTNVTAWSILDRFSTVCWLYTFWCFDCWLWPFTLCCMQHSKQVALSTSDWCSLVCVVITTFIINMLLTISVLEYFIVASLSHHITSCLSINVTIRVTVYFCVSVPSVMRKVHRPKRSVANVVNLLW